MKKGTFKLKVLTILFVLVNLFIVNSTMAQNKLVNDSSVLLQSSKIKPIEEFKEGKYVVRIIENQDKTFGYEIKLNNKQLVLVMDKKYFSIPLGYNKKENAKIVAKWHVMRIEKFNEKEVLLNLEQAKLLGITEDDLELSLYKNKNYENK